MKKIIYTFIMLITFMSVKEVFTYTNQPPLGLTGAPGEGTCSSCHGPTVTSGQIWNNMTLTTSVPLSAMQPGTTYLMSLTFSDPGSVKYGFQIVALPGNATSSSGSIGTIALNTGNTAVNVSSAGNRTYARTNTAGTSASNNTRTWNFNYTTPSVALNGVTFYAVVNSTDNNNMANSNDIIYTKSFSATVLPVKWLDVKAHSDNHWVEIFWSTASEINNDYFEIEQSADLENWETVAKLSGNGTTNTISHYTYRFPKSVNSKYFRIKQTDFDGKFSYSKFVSLSNHSQQASIWFNPESKTLHTESNEITHVKIIRLNGEVVYHQPLQNNVFSLNQLASGIYIVSATGAFGSTQNLKIVVQ